MIGTNRQACTLGEHIYTTAMPSLQYRRIVYDIDGAFFAALKGAIRWTRSTNMSVSSSPRTLRWLLAGVILLAGSGPALAQHGGHGGHGGGVSHGGAAYGGHWGGGIAPGGGGHRMDSGRWAFRPGYGVHSFSRPDFVRWSGGRWSQTCWGGRCGWWWATGGLWYFYAEPVYPYPLVVSPITYSIPIYDPGVTGLAPQPTFSYYCDNPQGYYPEVQQCNTPWRESSTPADSQ